MSCARESTQPNLSQSCSGYCVRLALASAGAEPKRAKAAESVPDEFMVLCCPRGAPDSFFQVEQPSADPAEAFGGEEEQEEEVEVHLGSSGTRSNYSKILNSLW